MQIVERSSGYNSSIFQKVSDSILGFENGVIELRVGFVSQPENSLRDRIQ